MEPHAPPKSTGWISLWRNLIVALPTAAASTAADLLVLAIHRVASILAAGSPQSSAAAGVNYTAMHVVPAAMVLAVISRLERNRGRTFWIMAVIALVLSFVPNVMLGLESSARRLLVTAHMTAIVGCFHMTAFAVSVPIPVRLMQPAPGDGGRRVRLGLHGEGHVAR